MWSHGGPVGDAQGWSGRLKRIKEKLHHTALSCIRPNIFIWGLDSCWDFAWGELVLPAGKRQRVSHKMIMAVLGKLEEKWHRGKGALGGLCFFGVAHVPAALLPGDNPICTAPKPESTHVAGQPQPRNPMAGSGRWEVKSLPQAKSLAPCTAKWYGQLGCKITAKITSCCLPTVWLEGAATADWISLSPLSGLLSAYASAHCLDKLKTGNRNTELKTWIKCPGSGSVFLRWLEN